VCIFTSFQSAYGDQSIGTATLHAIMSMDSSISYHSSHFRRLNQRGAFVQVALAAIEELAGRQASFQAFCGKGKHYSTISLSCNHIELVMNALMCVCCAAQL
jgi:hypothetical protein